MLLDNLIIFTQLLNRLDLNFNILIQLLNELNLRQFKFDII